MPPKLPCVYIMTNQKHGTLYTGVTSNLIKRVYEHKQVSIKSFTQQYHCTLLVFFEQFPTMACAIRREKQIKAGSRKKKINLIENINPKWEDLYKNII